MSKTTTDTPNLSSNTFFLGSAVILLLVSLIFAIGGSFNSPTIDFGSCQLKAEVARTVHQKAKGLSGRPEVPADYAMLFPFKQEQPYFWMKDMLVPIDIVWVNGKTVERIDANAQPDDGVMSYQAPGPIDWVVEVQAGQSQSCGVKAGTTINGLRY